MFCPNCFAYVTESAILKRKVKSYNDADIEYEAFCPDCHEQMGVMSWGKLQVCSDLKERYEQFLVDNGYLAGPEQQPEVEQETPYLDPPLPDMPTPIYDEENMHNADDQYDDWKQEQQSYSSAYPPSYTPDQLSGHYCPHCGHDLPNDINLLPRRYHRDG